MAVWRLWRRVAFGVQLANEPLAAHPRSELEYVQAWLVEFAWLHFRPLVVLGAACV